MQDTMDSCGTGAQCDASTVTTSAAGVGPVAGGVPVRRLTLETRHGSMDALDTSEETLP
jgi:hypothetical protein